jgi:succinate dehydrogenase / fumarate reductase cytochrome b subunit
MATAQTDPHARSNFWKWFDAFRRAPGMWAYALNRLSAIGLTVYLFMHLIVLRTLTEGPQAYDDFVALVKSPVFVFGELVVVIGGVYHGLNGLRVALTAFGIGVPYQKHMFYAVLIITAVVSLVFGIHMFTA